MRKTENKKMDKAVNNHYVPQYYLKNFFHNKTIYYKDIMNNYPVQRSQSAKNLCVEENLYTLHEKISDKDMEQFWDIIGLEDERGKEICISIKKYLNGDFSTLSNSLNKFIRKIASTYMDIQEKYSYTQEELYEYYDNLFPTICTDIIKFKQLPPYNKDKYAIDDLMLNLHIYCFRCAINSLYNGIIEKDNITEDEKTDLERQKSLIIKNFEYEQNDYMNVMLYIIVQLLRTNNSVKKLSSLIEDKSFKEKFSFLYIQFMPYIIVSNMVLNKCHIKLIKNYSTIDFITSDNPCINIDNMENLNLYIPISGKLAIKCNNYNNDNNISEISSDAEILKYNKLIKSKANQYIIGSSSDILDNV